MRQVVLDTETTGLKVAEKHRIIEVGAIELIDRRVTDRTFHHYVNPNRDIEQEASQVHGIDQKFLSDKPPFADIAAAFIDFIRDSELIIHNAPFDVAFLEYEFKLIELKPKQLSAYCQITDTLPLARSRHPGQRNSLDALCKRYHVNNSHRQWHGALLDAELLAQVYLAMTGGQQSLFDTNAAATRQIAIHKEKKQVADIALSAKLTPVIYANDSELALHQSFMAKLAAKNNDKHDA